MLLGIERVEGPVAGVDVDGAVRTGQHGLDCRIARESPFLAPIRINGHKLASVLSGIHQVDRSIFANIGMQPERGAPRAGPLLASAGIECRQFFGIGIDLAVFAEQHSCDGPFSGGRPFGNATRIDREECALVREVNGSVAGHDRQRNQLRCHFDDVLGGTHFFRRFGHLPEQLAIGGQRVELQRKRITLGQGVDGAIGGESGAGADQVEAVGELCRPPRPPGGRIESKQSVSGSHNINGVAACGATAGSAEMTPENDHLR